MIDVRLALPALAAWLGALAIQSGADTLSNAMVDPGTRRAIVGLATLGLVTACLPVILGWVPRPRGPGSNIRRSVHTSVRASVRASAASAIALGLAIGIASAGLMVVSLAADPVASWSSTRATATVQAVITGDPVARTRAGAAVWQGSTMIEARISSSTVTARGESVEVGLPMMLRVIGQVEASPSLPEVGSEVLITGRLGPSRTPGVAATLTVTDSRDIVVLDGPWWVDGIANAMRSGLQASVSGVPTGAGALVAGLAVGDESLLPPSLDASMRDAGLSHLTAVSGGNVAVVIVVVMGLARALGFRMRTRVLVCLVAVAAFVVLVRPQPSVLRASVMGAVVLLGMLGGGRHRGVGVLSTTILLLVAISPSLAVSWGFGLSVAATGGLILLAPVVQGRLNSWPLTRRWPPGWRDALGITLAAQAATLPLLVAMGSSVGWAAIPANLLAMPAVPAVTVLGLLAALTSPILPTIASLMAGLAAIPAAWIAWVATTCSSLPAATLPWPSGWAGIALMGSVSVVGWLAARRLRMAAPNGIPLHTRLAVVGVGIAGFVAFTIAPPSLRGWPPAGWVLVACDVGQGDGLVVAVEPGTAVVVDVGPDGDAMLACLRDLGVDRLSAIVLTHFHADHVMGLERVLARIPVGMIYLNPVLEPSDQARMVREVLQGTGVPSSTIRAGDRRSIGPVSWEVLWPRRVIDAGSVPNNASTVLMMEVDGVRLLLTGDIEPEAQVALMAGRSSPQADVVKVPHHGSQYQDPRFAAWSGGRIALVSVGAGNDYGHPAPQTLLQWQQHGALVGRTDLDGDIAVVQRGGVLGIVARRG